MLWWIVSGEGASPAFLERELALLEMELAPLERVLALLEKKWVLVGGKALMGRVEPL